MWQKILFYTFLLAAFFIFMKLSEIKVNGRNLIGLKYRFLIALIFPILIVLFIFFGLFILFLVIIVLAIFGIVFLFNMFRIKRI